MDAVILAAGRGSRLRGVTAPFWKPMMVVNGSPLIVSVVRQAWRQTKHNFEKDDRVVVVVSPENALPITQVLAEAKLPSSIDIVVQPSPRGPGDAFLRAAPFCRSRTLILCADNVIPDDDLKLVTDKKMPLVVGTRFITNPEEAARFTLIRPLGTFVEGRADVENYRWNSRGWMAWVGPLVVPTKELVKALEKGPKRLGDELKIGEALNEVNRDPVLVDVNCYDVGVPE